MPNPWVAMLLGAWLAGDGDRLPQPVQPEPFERAAIVQTWTKYAGKLTFGQGQTLALVDDGCNLSRPEWSRSEGPAPKVLVSHDSIDGDDDPRHGPRGYHGSTIGVPSSLNYQGRLGVAFNDQVAVVRGVECCHCSLTEAATLAAALQWVLDHHRQYRITAVNLAPVDDQEHAGPVPTVLDAKLAALRQEGIWVSAPCGNHGFRNGISWPACQPDCFAIGAVQPGRDEVHLDRSDRTDLLVPATATSSSNAILCGAVLVLREAIEKCGYDWKRDGPNLPEAMMALFRRTGAEVRDGATGRVYRRLDLLAAIDHVFVNGRQPLP